MVVLTIRTKVRASIYVHAPDCAKQRRRLCLKLSVVAITKACCELWSACLSFAHNVPHPWHVRMGIRSIRVLKTLLAKIIHIQ
jgi:hypothetical protein